MRRLCAAAIVASGRPYVDGLLDGRYYSDRLKLDRQADQPTFFSADC